MNSNIVYLPRCLRCSFQTSYCHTSSSFAFSSSVCRHGSWWLFRCPHCSRSRIDFVPATEMAVFTCCFCSRSKTKTHQIETILWLGRDDADFFFRYILFFVATRNIIFLKFFQRSSRHFSQIFKILIFFLKNEKQLWPLSGRIWLAANTATKFAH